MQLSPDGLRYLAATEQRVPRPFHYRWLLPKVCGRNGGLWQQATYMSLVLLAGLGWIYTRSWFGAVIPLGLAGVTKFNLNYPVLVDAPAMALALGAAVALREGWWPLAIVLVLVAGCVKETSPVFAALFAWNPLLLVGLVPAAVRHLQRPGLDVCSGPAADALARPLRTSWEHHRKLPLWVWVLPWGACLAGFAHPTWQVAACALVAYAQCALATDTCRLYQWAFPVLALNAVAVVPTEWLLPLALVHVVNPWATDGL